MGDKSVMNARLAAELDHAFERNGWTAQEVKKLSAGDKLGDVRRLLHGELKLVETEEEPLLSHVRTFAPTGAKPTIANKSDQFKDWFEGVSEGELSEKLVLHKLERRERDAAIITELGGEEMAEVSLADFWATLSEKERTGDRTWLLAYVRDKDEILCAVGARWGGYGWSVGAVSLGTPSEWHASRQVLSRPSAGKAGDAGRPGYSCVEELGEPL